MDVIQNKLNPRLHTFILVMVGLFPMLTVTLRHGGSTIYGLLILIGIVYAWPVWKQLSRVEKQFLLGYCVFALAMILSMYNTDDWPAAGKKLERVIRIVGIIPIFLLLRRFGIETLKAVVLGAGVGSIIVGIQAWYFSVIKGHAVVHATYHKIMFGDISIYLALIVALALLTVAKKWWHYVLGGICITAGLYASLMSMSRGAWLLIPLLVPLFIILYYRRTNKKLGFILVVGLVLLTVSGKYWLPNSVSVQFQRGMHDIHLYQQDPARPTSWGQRINMWRDSLTLFKAHPILGAGLGDFAMERDILIEKGEAVAVWGMETNSDIHYQHAHNIYFGALATSGILGLLALLLGIIIFPLRLFYRAWLNPQHQAWDRFAILAGICTVVAFAVFGLSEGWLLRNVFVNTYVITIAVFAASVGRFLSVQATHPAH